MDEGINQYANARVDGRGITRTAARCRASSAGSCRGCSTTCRWDRLVSGEFLSDYRSSPTVDIQATPSFRYWPRTSGPMTYAKPALWLHTLERALGWTTVQQILSTFFDRWKFKHPRPGDLFQVANEVSGRDLTPFFDQVYRGSAVFDYGVDSVTSAETDDETFVNDVVVRRHGDGIFPVTILATLANGEQRRFAWDGAGRWHRVTFEHASRVLSAQVDPDQVLVLDTNFTNNSFTTEPASGRAATKMGGDMAGLAAGSAAHLGLSHLTMTGQRAEGRGQNPRAADALRDGIRARQSGARRPRVRLRRHAAGGAAVFDDDAGDAAVASRQQHAGRAGRARRQRAMVERVHRSGGTAGQHVSAEHHRLRRGARQPQRVCRRREPALAAPVARRRLSSVVAVPGRRHPRPLRPGAADAIVRVLHRLRRLLRALPAAGAVHRARLLRALRSRAPDAAGRWFAAADAGRHRRADGVSGAPWRCMRCSAHCSCPSASSSTTPRCARSSKIAAA